jgi:hypothetical protein
MTTVRARQGFALRAAHLKLTAAAIACAVSVLAAALTMASPALAGSSAGSHVATASVAADTSSIRAANRALGVERESLRHCVREHPHRCAPERAALKRARKRRHRATVRLALLKAVIPAPSHKASGASGAKSAPPKRESTSSNDRSAPTLTVSGETLSWSKVGSASSYVLRREVTGQKTQESAIDATSDTPNPAPGVTARYAVRANVSGSEWSHEVSISYPASAPEAPGGESSHAKEPKTEEASSKASSGETLPSPIGEAPSPVGEAPSPIGEGGSSPGGSARPSFPIGLNSGREQLDYEGASKLGAKLVRLDCSIEESARELEPAIAKYTAEGVRVLPLADFYAEVPTAADAKNIASWATAFGPGGTFWKTHSVTPLPIEDIEFGNETDNGYQYGLEPGSPAYQSLAEAYARRFKEASEALTATHTDVGLLAQEQDPTGHWIAGMYAAVPNFAQYVAGWTIHPYGPSWRTSITDLIDQTSAYGASSSIPIDITEWGVSSDNGLCLTSNFDWNECMSYEEAATVTRASVAEMSEAFGSRVGMFMIFQVRDQQSVGATNSVEGYFGALQRNLAPKGAYTTEVQTLLSASG